MEWEQSIAAGGTFIISKDKNIRAVPEAMPMLLLGFGLVGLWGFRKSIEA